MLYYRHQIYTLVRRGNKIKLEQKNNLKIYEEYDIYVMRDGEVVKHDKVKNAIMNTGLNHICELLAGTVTGGYTYHAIGTSTVAVSSTQSALVAEGYRQPFSKKERSSTGELKSYSYINPDDGNIAIEEIAVFAGASATTAANSGAMVSRALWSHTKTSSESIYFVRTDTISAST